MKVCRSSEVLGESAYRKANVRSLVGEIYNLTNQASKICIFGASSQYRM